MNTSGFQVQLFSPAPDATVNWRLLSGNNREAGRGAGPARDVEACRLHVATLQNAVTGLSRRVRRAEPNHWVWELHANGLVYVVASHRFDRLIRCEQALDQFVAEFASAPVRDGLVISGARRWGRAS